MTSLCRRRLFLLAVVALICCFFLSVNMSDEFNTAFYEYVQTSFSSSSSTSSTSTDLITPPSSGAHRLVAASSRHTNASSRPTPPFGGLPFSRHRIQFLNEQYEYRMTEPTVEHVCAQKQLLVSVQVRADATERRDAIRRTWAVEIPDAVILRFFICDTDVDEQRHLYEENRRHGDMVFCDFPDDYFKMHLKIHAMMQWQQTFCSTAQFWLKADDDVVVHLPRLLHWINEDFRPNLAANPKAIFGSFVSGRVRRDKNDKWSVPYELYANGYYPTYSSGPSYVVTSAAVRAILNGTSSTNGFHVEDALYTGVIASNVGVEKFARRWLFHTEETLSDPTSCDANNVPYSTVVFMGGADKSKRMGALWNRLKSVRCYSLLWRILLFWKYIS